MFLLSTQCIHSKVEDRVSTSAQTISLYNGDFSLSLEGNTMVMRVGGFRRKTRGKLKKTIQGKGKLSLRRFFQVFDINTQVRLTAESGYQNGMYFPRFHGKSGIVVGTQGICYKVRINDRGKNKDLIIHPIHLKPQ